MDKPLWSVNSEALKTKYLELVNQLPDGEMKDVLQEYMRVMENTVKANEITLACYRR